MNDFSGYVGQPSPYQSQQSYQPNWYYQPTQTQVYQPRFQNTTTAAPSYSQVQSMQPVNTQIIWVDGEAAARAYNLPNNTTLPLWDSESQTIYIKSVDSQGKPQMTILDYVERDPSAKKEVDTIEYATKEQVDEINHQFTELNKKLSKLSDYVTKDQLDDLNSHVDSLGGQIEDIENRIMSFGKPQSNNSNIRKGNK